MTATEPTRRSWQRPDLVPLAQRLRYLQRYRILGILLVLALQATGVVPGDERLVALLGAASALGGTFAALVVRRNDGGGARWLFGIVLLADGLLLAVLAHIAGGLAGPVRYLVVLHVVIVTLVASHRTGVKLAIWHSLLALVVAEAIDIGWLSSVELAEPTRALATQLALVWTVTIVTASASAVNEREILRRRYDLDALARMSSELEQTKDLHGVAAVLTDHVAATFDARRAGVISLREGDPLPLAGHGLEPVAAAGTIEGILLELVEGRRTVLQSGLGVGDEWLAAQFPDAERLVVVPLVSGDSIDGALVVEFIGAAGERMERRIVATIERFAAQGALALANARLHGELVALAETDGLTGVANRASFDKRLVAELSRVQRQGSTFLLLLCDIDHFKAVNDEHGHQAGDAALVRVAQSLSRCARPYDTIARYGGEEFAVIMPMTTVASPEAIAERYRRSVSDAVAEIAVTISVGIVTVAAPASPAMILRAADRALYASKRDGRNRVTVAPPIVASTPGRDADG